jgi:lactoylglutathione lyase
MVVMNLVVLYVKDLERSRRFYEALGLEFVHEQHGDGPAHYACAMSDLVLELYPARAGIAPGGRAAVSLGFRVSSIPTVLEQIHPLSDVLGMPTANPNTVPLRLKDPDGHVVFVTADERP